MAETGARQRGNERVALVAGASGLVGRALIAQLATLPTPCRTIVLTRRPMADLPPGCEALQVDFETLEQTGLPQADLAFCTLGTTIKTAGSQAAFRRVDHDYCLAFARAAFAAGARRLCIVTALGADARSRVFYSRVKGEIEADVGALPFDAVHIFRPSFLAGARTESRPGEHFMLAALRPLSPLLPRRYRPVAVESVARAMIEAAAGSTRGMVIHESETIRP